MISHLNHARRAHLSAVVLVIFLGTPALAANLTNSPFARDIDSALKFQGENKLDIALRKCDLVLQQDNANVSALALRSLIYSSKGEKDKAWADEKKALLLPCKNALDELLVSKLLTERRRFNLALTHIVKAIQLNPNDARNYCQR